MVQIGGHKCTVLAEKDLFHRVGMVAMFLKIPKKIKIWVRTKRNGPFLRHYGATVPPKMPYSYHGRSLCLRCQCKREYSPNLCQNCAIFALIFSHVHTSTAWRAPTQVPRASQSHGRMSACPRPAACRL